MRKRSFFFSIIDCLCFAPRLFASLPLSLSLPSAVISHVEKPRLSYTHRLGLFLRVDGARRSRGSAVLRGISSSGSRRRRCGGIRHLAVRHLRPLCSGIRSVPSLSLGRTRLCASLDSSKRKRTKKQKRVSRLSLASSERKKKTSETFSRRPLHRNKKGERKQSIPNHRMRHAASPPRPRSAHFVNSSSSSPSTAAAAVSPSRSAKQPPKYEKEREREREKERRSCHCHQRAAKLTSILSITFASRRSVFPSPARLTPRDTNDTMATATAVEATQKVRSIGRELRV